MKRLFCLLPFVAISILSSSCGHGGDNTAEEAVDSFSVAYFNWRFVDAQRFSTAQSHRWLSFASSQVTQEIVDSLRSMQEGAGVKVESVDYTDDTAATAVVTVSNALTSDSIGIHPSIAGKRRYVLPLVLHGNRWKVDLTSLPKEQK